MEQSISRSASICRPMSHFHINLQKLTYFRDFMRCCKLTYKSAAPIGGKHNAKASLASKATLKGV